MTLKNMKNNNYAKDLRRRLQDIDEEYTITELTRDNLIRWITDCIQNSIKKQKYSVNSAVTYKDCRIEYLQKQLLFSLIIPGDASGVLYDVAINVQPYLKTYLGTDNLNILNNVLTLLDSDVRSLSEELCEDIDEWCDNITYVFNAVYPAQA
jgi:hypothetical protein